MMKSRKNLFGILILSLVLSFWLVPRVKFLALMIYYPLQTAFHLELTKDDYNSLCESYGGSIDFKGDCINLEPPEGVDAKVIPPNPSVETICAANGGTWGEFSSTCQDRCNLKMENVCGQALTEGCHCPEGTCYWNGGCFRAPKWHYKFDGWNYSSTKMLIYLKKLGWPY